MIKQLHNMKRKKIFELIEGDTFKYLSERFGESLYLSPCGKFGEEGYFPASESERKKYLEEKVRKMVWDFDPDFKQLTNKALFLFFKKETTFVAKVTRDVFSLDVEISESFRELFENSREKRKFLLMYEWEARA